MRRLKNGKNAQKNDAGGRLFPVCSLQSSIFGLFAVVASGAAWWLFADTFSLAPANADGARIRFAHFGGYEDFEFWQRTLREFEQQNPGVHVQQEYIVGLGGHYNLKLRQQVLSGTLPDVALIQLAAFHELAEHFADLSHAVPEPGILDVGALTAFQHDGVQRGLPIAGGDLAIYVNPDCVQRAETFRGPPLPLPAKDWTLEEFREFSRLLTCDFDGDGRTDQFGFWLPTWVYFLPFVWSSGAELTDENATQWQFCGPAAERATRLYRGIAVEDHSSPREEEVPQLFQDVGFLTGRVAMCVNGPWFQPFLSHTSLRDAYVVLPVPGGPAGSVTRMTWDGVVLAPDLPPRRHELAKNLLRFVISHEPQARLARIGRAVPARLDARSEFADVDPSRRGVFVDSLATARLQPVFAAHQEVDAAFNRFLAAMAGPEDIEPLADRLVRLALDPAIRRAFPTTPPCTP